MQPTAPLISRLGHSLRGFAIRLLDRLSILMRTGDPAATMDRLFDSRHVRDLRLIIAGTLLSVGVSAALCLFYAFEQVAFAGQWSVFGAVQFLAYVVNLLAYFIFCLSPVVAVAGAIAAWVYRIGSARLGVVDLFACEISTLCRIATVVDTVHNTVESLDRVPSVDPTHSESPPAETSRFTSQENYFPVFEGNNRDLQSLEARVVINITAFYTYMKVVRDLKRAQVTVPPGHGGPELQSSAQPLAALSREPTRNLIYMLFLGLESARNSIKDLVEFQPERAERIIVILISELEAYQFLVNEFTDDTNMRRRRLLLRWEDYDAEVPKLCSQTPIEMEKAKEKLSTVGAQQVPVEPEILAAWKEEYQRWKAANELLPDLSQRYESAKAAVTPKPATAIAA
jgi:hypothetical protein